MTIDRAIEILNPEHRECYGDIEEVNEACRMGMEALKRQRWIPCGERMPENNQRVLAYGRDNRVHDAEWSWPDNAWYDKITKAIYMDNFVTHWMPLPEAPEKGGNGNATDRCRPNGAGRIRGLHGCTGANYRQ